ncbi:uncharacterized protein LOC114129404 [Aphis gossypii]|uniref:uncharacterized protein LOC114129404 n=1 Tax=Aphis gossypii TaxID=80765 RepID=UPI0021599F3D|nr:uncharacterized protein LOC114129404 [Aphis gossypii]
MVLVRNNQHIATIVRMLMALPHLPPERIEEYPENFHILEGFLEVQRLARDMNVAENISELFNYFQNYWINIIGPHGFSVYGVNIRTNNYIESFHSTIQTIIGRHPPLWTFYDRLRLVERRVRRETQQIINGHQVRRAILTSRDSNNQLLITAFQNVRNGRYDTSAFLRRVAHSARGYWDQQIGPLPTDVQLNDQPPNALVLRPLQTPQYLPGRIRRGAGRGRDQVREQPAV